MLGYCLYVLLINPHISYLNMSNDCKIEQRFQTRKIRPGTLPDVYLFQQYYCDLLISYCLQSLPDNNCLRGENTATLTKEKAFVILKDLKLSSLVYQFTKMCAECVQAARQTEHINLSYFDL